jgi:hypothetical protein
MACAAPVRPAPCALASEFLQKPNPAAGNHRGVFIWVNGRAHFRNACQGDNIATGSGHCIRATDTWADEMAVQMALRT